MAIRTVNPTTGEVEATFEALDATALDERLALAADTFGSYRRTTFAERRTWMRDAATLLERHGLRSR